ncbi:MAG: S41 family peptidase [Chloroflexota bacterium]|nr:S41 family peptidase [Chloroflexota bacterium]
MKRLLANLAFVVVVVGVVTATYLAGFGTSWVLSSASPVTQMVGAPPSSPVPTATSLPASFRLLQEAWDVVNQEFYGKKTLDPQVLVQGAIKGMVDALGDQHTYFLTAQNAKIAEEDLQGSFEGIGATIEKRDNKLLIVAPIEGSPAEKAGLRAGDQIAAVDGKSTAPMTTMDAVSLIRGPAGTVVRLVVVRDGVPEGLKLDITRAKIEMYTVRTKDLDNGVAYVRITSFSEPTSQELSAALRKVLANKPKGLVLDLRNNPGGYLTTSVEVASQFLKDGAVVYEENADGKRQTFSVRRGGLATDLPMVVLVNKGSASASEIVAGAIQDAGRGPLIGEKTFGKGSVQTTHTLSDGSSVHITIAHWFTPKGRQIHEVGLQPDITVLITEDDMKNNKDPQLDRALEYLATGK